MALINSYRYIMLNVFFIGEHKLKHIEQLGIYVFKEILNTITLIIPLFWVNCTALIWSASENVTHTVPKN